MFLPASHGEYQDQRSIYMVNVSFPDSYNFFVQKMPFL